MKTYTRHNTHIIIFVFAMLLASMLLACSSDEDILAVPDNAQAGQLSGLEPCVYETGDVEYAAECGTLTVPENRSVLDTRLIALPVMRVNSTGTSAAEPIFWLNGGPGQSNMRFSHPQDLTALLTNHDFVLVGYRGVDGSVVLDCPEISQALRNPTGKLLSETALTEYGVAAASCRARLEDEGVDLLGYTMTETIDDMEAARAAFGYGRVNLLGASYGTRLAMTYEWRHPESLERVAMIEVNTPGHFVWEPETIEAQLADYARLCAADAACHARTSDLLGTMRAVSNNIPARWRLVPIDEDKVKLFSFVMFYESIQAPGSPVPLHGPAAIDMWVAANEGDFGGMALVSALTNRFIPNLSTWGHLLAMGSDTGEYSNLNRDYRAEFADPDLILGSPVSLLIWGMGQGWPANPDLSEYTQLQPSGVPTLLEAGSVDFSTPPAGAWELLPYLGNGDLVFLEEFGHGNTFWNSQPEARLHMLTTFFDTGEVDASRYVYQPLDFDVGRGWPDLARIVVAVPLLIVAVVGALIWWFVRRIRRGNMETYQVPNGKPYRDWQAVFDDAQPLPWTAFNTGYIYGALKNNAQSESFPSHRNPAERYEYAVMAFHFRHPTHGDILIDTGFDRTYHDNPPYGNLSFAMRAYNRLMNVQYTQRPSDIDLMSQLKKHQIAPAHVFLTHLHADHTGGLPALPARSHIYYGKEERTLLSRLLCSNHFRGKSSIHLLDMEAGKALSPFSRVLDLFGDGTLWAMSTPGHGRDHLSYLINTTPAPILIVGDAELTIWAMEDEILVSTVDGARGKQAVQRSATMIRTFHTTYPNVQIWFSHDEDHL